LRPSTAVAIVAGTFLGLGWLLLFLGAVWVWIAGLVLYALALLMSGLVASLRFRSFRVGGLALTGTVLTHVVFARSFVAGAVRR
jgi:hypothetical protein